MYLQGLAALLLVLIDLSASEVCNTQCKRKDSKGLCLEIEVVEIFHKAPAKYPWMSHMRNMVRNNGHYIGKGTRCPKVDVRPTERPVEKTTPRTTPRTTPSTTTTYKPVYPPDYYDEVESISTTEDPNAIIYKPEDHTIDYNKVPESHEDGIEDMDDNIDNDIEDDIDDNIDDNDMDDNRFEDSAEEYDGIDREIEDIDSDVEQLVEVTTKKPFSWFG